MDAVVLREACLEIQARIHMMTDEIAKSSRLLDHLQRRGAVLLPLCGRWSVDLTPDVRRNIADFLLPVRPTTWHAYPELDVLPGAPVMPYDFGHHNHLDFIYPGYVLPNAAVWHQAGEDEWRVYVTRLSLNQQCTSLRVFRGEVREDLAFWEGKINEMRG